MKSFIPNLPLPSGTWLSVVSVCPPAVCSPADLRRVETPADMIEIRVDLMADSASPSSWIQASPRPVLATLRSLREGGAFEGTDDQAAAILAAWREAGAHWVDAELGVDRALDTLGIAERHRLLSFHPEDCARVSVDARWCKFALSVDAADAWTRLRVHHDSARGFVVPMGGLAHARGAFVGRARAGLLFGAYDDESLAVPQQPRLMHLLEELRAGEVDARATLFGLVGEPPSWSPSPAMHNAAFRSAGVNALYLPFPRMSLDAVTALPVRGVSVTHPYKSAAFASILDMDEDARRARAVNTLLRVGGGGWRGLNTDVGAIRTLVAAHRSDAGAARVYGSGGFARAAVVALQSLGIDVRIAARRASVGRALADSMNCAWAGTDMAPAGDEWLLVNATPAGLRGVGEVAMDAGRLRNKIVIDAPYGPPGQPTDLVRAATKAHARHVVDGRTLLLEQAHGQARAFLSSLGHAPDAERKSGVFAALANGMLPPDSLALIGPRGAGKSTCGARLAQRTGRPFLDLDDEVARFTGRSAADWIEQDGESAFREVESIALMKALLRRGVVLACGAGIVEHLPNKERLASCFTVYLEASPEVTSARVTRDAALRPRLYDATDDLDEACILNARRCARWTSWSDATVDANRMVTDTVNEILSLWQRTLRSKGP